MPADHRSFHTHPMGVAQLPERFKARQATIGMDYVGLPLALTAAKAGFNVLGFERGLPMTGWLKPDKQGFSSPCTGAMV
jgi:hypothetical protein